MLIPTVKRESKEGEIHRKGFGSEDVWSALHHRSASKI